MLLLMFVGAGIIVVAAVVDDAVDVVVAVVAVAVVAVVVVVVAAVVTVVVVVVAVVVAGVAGVVGAAGAAVVVVVAGSGVVVASQGCAASAPSRSLTPNTSLTSMGLARVPARAPRSRDKPFCSDLKRSS